MHNPIPKGTAVIVCTTNGGEIVCVLAADYVPSYAVQLTDQAGYDFSVPAYRLKSVEPYTGQPRPSAVSADLAGKASDRFSPLGHRPARYLVTRIDRAASEQVSVLQTVYEASDQWGLCRADYEADGIERIAVSLVEGGAYFTIPREDVSPL